MTEFDLKRVDEVLESYGNEVITNMKSFLAFTTDLKNSIKQSVTASELKVTMPYYAVFIEDGRRKGAPMPPATPILNWMKSKGIPVSALYPIRRKIAKDGIPKREFFHYFTDKLQQLENDVARALETDVVNFIVSNSVRD